MDDLDCLLSLLLSVIRSQDDWNDQDLDCFLSLLLRLMRSASLATAKSDLDCKIFQQLRAMFIDMPAVVMATFYVATVSMHNLLNTVAKVLACLQHHVQSEDVVPFLKRNIEQLSLPIIQHLHFIHTPLICCSRTHRLGTLLGPQTACCMGSQAMQSSGLRSGECAGLWDLPSNAHLTSSMASDWCVWCVCVCVMKQCNGTYKQQISGSPIMQL